MEKLINFNTHTTHMAHIQYTEPAGSQHDKCRYDGHI